MKSLLLAILLSGSCWAAEAPPKYINTWGGLDVYHDSSKLADSDASKLSNVLTDRGFLEKRPGSEVFQTLLNGWSVQYLQEFISPSKTRYLVAHASSTVYYSDTSAAFAVLSTTTISYNLDCTSAFGKLYCADGFAQPWSWTGAAKATAPGFPICTFLEFVDERVYCANTTAGDSRVHAGAFGDATNWTVPAILNADSPNLFTFQRTDGEGITCFKSTPWGKFVGKRHSTHILKGQDNDTYYKRLIDPVIGCVDDRSVQMVDGVLMWLGLEGVYAWEGSGAPELISQDIDPEIKQARQLASNRANWVNSTQADFEAGKLDVSGPGALVSATINPGGITVSSWTHVDTSSADWAAGELINIDTITIPNSISISFDTTTSNNLLADFSYGILSSTWTAPSGMSLCTITSQKMDCGLSHGAYTESTSYYGVWIDTLSWAGVNGMQFDFMSLSTTMRYNGYGIYTPSNIIYLQKYVNGVSTNLCDSGVISVPNPGQIKISRTRDGLFNVYYGNTLFCSVTDTTFLSSNYLMVGNISGGATSVYFDNIYIPARISGSWTSPIFDTSLSTPVGGPFSFSDTVPVGSTIAYSVRGSTAAVGGMNAWTLVSTTTSGAYRMSSVDGKRYQQYKADFSTSYSTQTPQLNDVTLMARTTAEYYSDVKYIGPAISSWLTFDSNESADGGSLSYWVRTSGSVFAKDAAAPAWVAQTNHLQVSTATGAYYQWRALFNVPSGSNTVTINDVTTNWQEGAASPVASLVWDHRYHLCVMNSSSTATNDRCWVYQRNKKWTHFDGPNYATLTLFNNEPLAGSAGTDGKIYRIMHPGLYNDDHVAIDAYWETPDFTFDAPNHQKDLKEVWIDGTYNIGGTLDVGYAMNRSAVVTSTSTTLDSTVNYVSKRVENLVDGYASGRYVRLRYGNDTIDQYFRLNTTTIYADIEPLIPD